MARNRPDYLDLGGLPYQPPKAPFSGSSYSDAPPSPHTGEIPPALSPLDALAYQGRLLAKRFEEKNKNGRRLGGLPPLTIKEEFTMARPGYFRSLSAYPHCSSFSESLARANDDDEFVPHVPREVRQ